MEEVNAQGLYDLREEFGFCSGTDLHDWFRSHLGDPSPSGYCYIWNNGGDWPYVDRVELAAQAAFNPSRYAINKDRVRSLLYGFATRGPIFKRIQK